MPYKITEDPRIALREVLPFIKESGAAGTLLQKAQTIGVVADASAFSSFLNKFIADVRAAKVARGAKNADVDFFDGVVVNTASTVWNGKKFRYYGAVDTGRVEVSSAGGLKFRMFLAQARKKKGQKPGPGVVFSSSVDAVAGRYITLRSLAEIKRKFNSRIEKDIKRFLASQAEHFQIPLTRGGSSIINPKVQTTGRSRTGFAINKNKEKNLATRKHSVKSVKVGELGGPADNFLRLFKDIFESEPIADRPKTTKAKALQKDQGKYGITTLSAVPHVPVDLLDEIVSEDYYTAVDGKAGDTTELQAQIDLNTARVQTQEYYELIKERTIKQFETKKKSERKKVIGKLKATDEQFAAVFGRLRRLEARSAAHLGTVISKPPKPNRRSEDTKNFKEIELLRKSEFLNAFLRMENSAALASIFMPSVVEAVKVFKKNTPRRKGYKLLANNTYLTPSKNSDDDELKNSYRIVTRGELTKMIRKFGK